MYILKMLERSNTCPRDLAYLLIIFPNNQVVEVKKLSCNEMRCGLNALKVFLASQDQEPTTTDP